MAHVPRTVPALHAALLAGEVVKRPAHGPVAFELDILHEVLWVLNTSRANEYCPNIRRMDDLRTRAEAMARRASHA